MSVIQANLWLKYWEERNGEVFEYDGEAAILASQFKTIGAKSILSLGCGTGPYLRRLAPLGFEGTGIDRDQSLLDIGNKLARKQGHVIRLVRGDIRKLSNIGMYDAAFAMHLTFPQDDWMKILRGLKPLLKHGGVFIAGFVHADTRPLPGTKGVSADLLSFSSGKNMVEVDCYLVEDTHYQCSMILLDETASEVLCDRHVTRIYFFPQKAEIIDLLTSQGYKDSTELRKDEIGFPGLKAVLLKTISFRDFKGD